MSGETHGQTPPCDGGFTLEADDGYTLTSGQLAERVGVSDQTVRNHASKLGGEHARKHAKAGWRFRPSAVEVWKHVVPSARKGGKRRGSGRKKTLGERPLTKAAADVSHAKQAIRDRLTRDPETGELPHVDPTKLMRTIDVLRCTREELALIVSFAHIDESLLSDAQKRSLREAVDLKAADLKLEKEMGTLVPVEGIARAWGEESRRIRDQVETIGRRVSKPIASSCWVSDEVVAAVCRMLKEHGVEGGVVTAVADMLAPPADLVGRVRGFIDEEVQRVMDSIADQPD